MPIYETVQQVETAESTLKYGFPESNVHYLYKRHVVYFDTQKRLAKWVAYKLAKDDIEGINYILYFTQRNTKRIYSLMTRAIS